MTQLTAKTVEDVLRWVESTAHHSAAWRPKHGRGYAQLDDPEACLVLAGYGDTLRIPAAIHKLTDKLVEPSREKFDTRMYRATKAGRARLRRAA
jgi:hypothetical protein